MFICIVPSPTFNIPRDVLIKGKSEYSGLPDFMFMSKYKRTTVNLNNSIGIDLIMPPISLYKAYAIWNNILFEYSLAGSIVPTWNDDREFLFPVSIKRYGNDNRTFLYVKSIETLMNIVSRTNTLNSEQYCNMSVAKFFKEMTSRCKDRFYLDKIKDFNPTIYDMYLSQECPDEISNILFELGNECLNYSDNAAAYLYFNYNYDINLLGEVFSYGRADDIISSFGCSEQCAFDRSKLIGMIDASSNAFYNVCAQSQIEKDNEMFNVRYLDKTSYLYDVLRIDDLLQNVYSQPYTDANAEITCNHISSKNAILTNYSTFEPVYNIWEDIRTNMNMYNQTRAKRGRQMVKINICKTWLDELYISIAFDTGDIENWFINLVLYHLYSPSIIRIPISEVLNSLQK